MKFKFPEAPEFDETVVTIEAWWDRYVQIWTVQKMNAAGDQIGETGYGHTKEDAAICVRWAREAHPDAKVVAPKSLRPFLR